MEVHASIRIMIRIASIKLHHFFKVEISRKSQDLS